MCQGTFSVRQGTAYCGIRVEEPNYTIAMRALAELSGCHHLPVRHLAYHWVSS